MRDTQLDIYRALLMMCMPCVFHIMYWLGNGSEPYQSVLLVEMSLVFFLSGAAFSVSRHGAVAVNRAIVSDLSCRVVRHEKAKILS